MPKCPDIRIIHTAYKKNGHVVVWVYISTLFGAEVARQFSVENHKHEKFAIFTNTFWIIPIFNVEFSMSNCTKIFILHNIYSTYYLTNQNLFHYPLQRIYFRITIYYFTVEFKLLKATKMCKYYQHFTHEFKP